MSWNQVKSVEIRGLFGRVDYQLPPTGRDSLGSLVILYGDNGSGKTTILNALFHLLSAANDRSHRSLLAQIPFRRIEVELSDGTKIWSARDHTNYVGEMTLGIRPVGEPEIIGRYGTTVGEGRKLKFMPRSFESKYLEGLNRLQISLYLLGDDRKIVSDQIAKPQPRVEYVAQLESFIPSTPMELESSSKGLLRRTVDLAVESLRSQAIKATSQGSANANQIYTDIAKRLATPQPLDTSSGDRLGAVAERIESISIQSREFARYGLVAHLKSDEILDAIGRASTDQRTILATVLEPYAEGLAAQLDSLQAVQSITRKFVVHLNRFFVDKKVYFDITNGLYVVGNDGEPIDLDWLSSGERHLLLLFCHTILARTSPCIFMIDEPELSLNMKWQRMLVPALVDLTSGGRCQFFFATHSFEILSQNLERVVQLDGGHEADE